MHMHGVAVSIFIAPAYLLRLCRTLMAQQLTKHCFWYTQVIPCSTCIKRGSPDKCRVDDEADRPSQPFAQARELEAVRDRVQKLEQLICMLAPVQARALGLEAHHYSGNDSDNGSNMGGAGNNTLGASVSPTNLSFGGGSSIGMPQQQLGLAGAAGSNPFMLSMQGLNNGGNNNKLKKKKRHQQQQNADSDSELDEDEEGEDGREAEKAAFALESIAVAGRPSAVSTLSPTPQIICTRLCYKGPYLTHIWVSA